MIPWCFRAGSAMHLYLVKEIWNWWWWRERNIVFRVTQSQSWNYRWSNAVIQSFWQEWWDECPLWILWIMRYFQISVFFFLTSEQLLFLLEDSANFSNRIGSHLEWQSFALGGQNADTEIFLLESWFSRMKERYRLLGETESLAQQTAPATFQADAETNDPAPMY